MKNIFIVLLCLIGFSSLNGKELHMNELLNHIKWSGQASVLIQDKLNIYFDPFQVKDTTIKADLIFITHCHQDHLSAKDIAKIIHEETILIAPRSCELDILNCFKGKTIFVEPGDTLTVKRYSFFTVPAYNLEKKFHPKENKWVGYVVDISGIKVYHAGDTDRIPEMKKFQCDLAFLPIGQTYTMKSVDDAVNAAKDVNAKTAVPIHYGIYEGTKDDALKFKNKLKGKVEVKILEY